jgi:hypothetical protein
VDFDRVINNSWGNDRAVRYTTLLSEAAKISENFIEIHSIVSASLSLESQRSRNDSQAYTHRQKTIDLRRFASPRLLVRVTSWAFLIYIRIHRLSNNERKSCRREAYRSHFDMTHRRNSGLPKWRSAMQKFILWCFIMFCTNDAWLPVILTSAAV